MIDWSASDVSITVPPVLRNVSNEELIAKLSDDDDVPDWEFSEFPCHTMAMERMVKIVMEASAQVCGRYSRDRFIRSTLLSRERLTKFENKVQFVRAVSTNCT